MMMWRTRAKILTKIDKGMKTVQYFSTTEQNRIEEKEKKREKRKES
jgi:hypothetical protein